MTLRTSLDDLKAVTADPRATPQAVRMALECLEPADLRAAIEDPEALCPLPGDGRSELDLRAGGAAWKVLWWDRHGRRVIAYRKFGGAEGGAGWLVDAEETPGTWPD